MNFYNDLLNESIADKFKEDRYYSRFTVAISEALANGESINIEVTLKSKDNKGYLKTTFYSKNEYLYRKQEIKDKVIKDSYTTNSICSIPNRTEFNNIISRYISNDEFKLTIKKVVSFDSYEDLIKEPEYQNHLNYETINFNPIAETKII